MLGTQRPPPMPHAVTREPHLDVRSSRLHKADMARPMQLPVPRPASSFEQDAMRALGTRRPPATSPSDLHAASVSQAYGDGSDPSSFLLPAIGNARLDTLPISNTISTATSPTQQKQKQLQQMQLEASQRKKWSISPNLRIPPTIATPQEGLPQLAAEVTCLFWFESSATLKQVVDGSSPRFPLQPLVPDAIPTTGFRKWVATILTTTAVASNVILLALLFVYRLKLTNPSVKGKPGSEYRLLTVALMLGNKFLDDNTYTNKTWAEVSGISVQEVHIMEVEFLSNMRYSLFTSKTKWDDWHVTLGKFGTFFDRASKVQQQQQQQLAAPTPSLAVSPSYGMPPQASPPSAMLYSPVHASYAPALLPPQPTSAVLSPTSSVHESGFTTQRKRSADYGIEPPAKRQAHGFAPGPYSNAPLVPAPQAPVHRSFEPPASSNRLPPLPSLSIPTPQSNPPQQVKSWSELPLPPQGSRSMAMVYPGPVPWPQPQAVHTPTSTGTPAFSNVHTPNADRTRHVSPFPASAGSSPVSASFATASRQLSPSYLLSQRQSPYRPVRGVHTLLVPPPSASMYDPARSVPHHQMQYQPLGRPTTERRAGPLPYMDHGAWPEMNQYNQLPLPGTNAPQHSALR